jgi:hypothetical protein
MPCPAAFQQKLSRRNRLAHTHGIEFLGFHVGDIPQENGALAS